MKSEHNFSVLFFLKGSKEDPNIGYIFLRVTVDGRRTEISLKRKVLKENWNADKGALKGTKEEIRKINNEMDEAKGRVYDIYHHLIREGKLVTPQAIKDLYTGKEDKEYTLLGLVAYHNKNHGNLLSWGSLKNYRTTEKYLIEFIPEKYRTQDIYLKQLNFKFLKDFEYWLREDRPCNNNTVIKHIQRLRKMINMAVANDWMTKDPFASFKGKMIKSDREFLSKEELEVLESEHFEEYNLDEIRDAFVFSCYTGMSYADLEKLTVEDLAKGIDGETWIFTKRTKTSVASNVPLLPKAFEILHKYKDHIERQNHGKLLPMRSNQKMNKYLKTVALRCGIRKALTFHMARHTFATTVTLTNGVPIETVSSMLGHTSIRTTQIYAKVIEKKVSEDMGKLRRLFSADDADPAINQ